MYFFVAIADACGVMERGHAFVDKLKARVNAVTTALTGVQPVKCICMEWIDPIYNAGKDLYFKREKHDIHPLILSTLI